MLHLFYARDRRSLCSRALALAALLLFAAGQVQEAGHKHASDETFAECLLCKHSVDTAVPSSGAAPPPSLIAGVMLSTGSVLHFHFARSPFDARGPPAHS